jgi:thiol-disulfide isomerase/thioredoxin
MRTQSIRFCQLLIFNASIASTVGLLHAQPANDLFANRIVVTGTNTVATGSNVGATREASEPLHAGASGGRSVWWSWTAPFSGLATISTAGTDFDTLLGIYIGLSVSGLTEVASNDDDQGLTSRVTFFAMAGQVYQIAVDGYGGSSGNVHLGVQLIETPPSTNDLFASRIIITGSNGVVIGSNFGATSEPGEPGHAGAGGGLSVWWSWTAPFSGTATMSTAGSDFDTVLAVYTGTSVSGLTEVISNDDGPNQVDHTSTVNFFAKAGQTYQIAVDGFLGDSGNIRLSFQLALLESAPPWILPDPYGVLVNSTNFTGQVVILDFWASWCVPCKLEIPDLVALQDKYRADGLVVVGATVGDLLQDTTTFLATNTLGVNYQIVMADPIAAYYGGIPYIPSTFIINRQNLIVRNFVGTQTMATLEDEIIPLLYNNIQLALQESGSQLTLSWPTNAVTFTLETAGSIQNPLWTQWPTNPTVLNGLKMVTLSPNGTNRFFRLRLQQ